MPSRSCSRSGSSSYSYSSYSRSCSPSPGERKETARRPLPPPRTSSRSRSPVHGLPPRRRSCSPSLRRPPPREYRRDSHSPPRGRSPPRGYGRSPPRGCSRSPARGYRRSRSRSFDGRPDYGRKGGGERGKGGGRGKGGEKGGSDAPLPEPGTVHEARVMALKPFGVFVAIAGLRREGLVHISQLASRRVETADEVVSVGDEVKVVVLSARDGRLSLSMRQVDQSSGEVTAEAARGGGSGGGGGRGGDSGPLPELYSIHKVEVARLTDFGAFCTLPGSRRDGLLHISQLANSRVEAADLPHILEVGEEIFVKVISVDELSGKLAFSRKLASQSDGRDLDPSHVEAAAEGERRGGGGGKGSATASARERDSQMAAMNVPEYGGKQRGSGPGYDLVSDGEDEGPSGPDAGGTYNLKMPDGSAAPSEALQARKRQAEIAAQLLAEASAKKAKKEKKRDKKERDKSEKKKSSKHKKEKHKHKEKDKKRKDKDKRNKEHKRSKH